MEERAKERKEKREALKKQMEDKKNKEQELKAKATADKESQF
jgi:hypothetical protein